MNIFLALIQRKICHTHIYAILRIRNGGVPRDGLYGQVTSILRTQSYLLVSSYHKDVKT